MSARKFALAISVQMIQIELKQFHFETLMSEYHH